MFLPSVEKMVVLIGAGYLGYKTKGGYGAIVGVLLAGIVMRYLSRRESGAFRYEEVEGRSKILGII